jgi:hypothetical protein
MRLNTTIGLILTGLAGLFGILFLKYLSTPVSQIPPLSVSASPSGVPQLETKSLTIKLTDAHQAAVAPQAAPTLIVTAAPPAIMDAAALAEEQRASIQARIAHLNELEAKDDSASLQAILSELTNPEMEIRAAAIESTIQFQSRDAIPALADLAARTSNPQEKQALLDAAEFLKLPTMTEIRAQKSKAGNLQ